MLKMRSLKRGVIIITSLFVLLGLIITFFIRSFDINDYSGLISQQIEKSTGYQVSFEQIDSNLYQKSHIAIKGVSLSNEQQQTIFIKKVNIEVKDFDIWNQRLDIQLLQLIGVDISSEQQQVKPPIKPKTKPKTKVLVADMSSRPSVSELALQSLHVQHLDIVDLNADISNVDLQLQIEAANLSSNRLVIIENHQFNNNFLAANLDLELSSLALTNSSKQSIYIEDLQLQTDFNLLMLEGLILSNIKQLEIKHDDSDKLVFDSLSVDAKLDKTKLLVQKLSANVFQGRFELQANARFSLTPFSSTAIALKQLNIDSLLLKDMQLQSQQFDDFFVKQPEEQQQTTELPVEGVLLQRLDLDNMNLNSSDQQQALVVKNLSASVRNLQIIKNNQWLDLPTEGESGALLGLKFDYLKWSGREFEQFSAAASLNKNDHSLDFITQLFLRP